MTDFIENCTLLIQGPNRNNYSKYRENYDNKIIVSTWESSFVNLDDSIIFIEQPLPKLTYQIYNPQNLYYQCVSTLAGLKKCNTEYIIKLRSDEYFSDLEKLYLKSKATNKFVCLPIFFRKSFSVPYHISDHVICHKTSVLLDAYTSCLAKCSSGRTISFMPEVYFFKSWVEDNVLHEINWDRSLARIVTKNCVDIVNFDEIKEFRVVSNQAKKVYTDTSFQNLDYDIIKSINEL